MEAEGKNGKMSGNDSPISLRESREERFEKFALSKDGLTSRREPISLLLGSRCFYSQYFRLVDRGRFGEQVLGLCEEGFRDFAAEVCIASLFIGERVEDTELRWTHLQRVPGCGSGFSLNQW